MKNSFHRQTYWPLWEGKETLTFRGGKLPNNAIEQSGNGTYWVLYRYAADSYGYVDASLNTDDYSTFDIDWAVDADGNPVHLDEINYIRVVCGIFQYCGWLGETSTEVCGFEDLHLIPGYDDNPIIIPTRPRPDDTAVHPTIVNSQSSNRQWHNLAGQKVGRDYKGIVIQNGRKVIR